MTGRRRIAIIGAGPGGICIAIQLLQAGIDDFVVLEQGSRVGGTWYHNRYPGAECDVMSHLYSYSFELNRQFLDGAVLVSDDEIKAAMRLLFYSAKLVSEPAGAAALAALMHPLRPRLEGARVAVIVCGANIDAASFSACLLDGDRG